ncbi:expressed unknown protein [Seminavis robusta]|uniref:Uncharacterized protein n=1 Tax=Seminavis robusta TaxID=568900 RepID=A0A9N8DLX1_9STRA|nr:expressed unknown protein [Seminavis robusta]|eukprot:Sro229_g093140.1 n/a (654) ;mRNA; r:72072-74692
MEMVDDTNTSEKAAPLPLDNEAQSTKDDAGEDKAPPVKPSAHFSMADNVEYEYETVHDLDDRKPDDETHQARRRASHLRASQRASISGTPFDVSYHPSQIVLYSRPQQRQRWGDTQVLPRVNWGDLFFDLYYVAAAYNTSNILVDSPSGKGLLYFFGTFLPLMGIWNEKTYFDGRFVVGDDLFHRLVELFGLVILATAVLHIRPVEFMSNSAEHVDMFVFSLMVLIANVLELARNIELSAFGIGVTVNGRNVVRQDAKRWFIMTVPYTALILAAAVIAGIEYYGNKSTDNDKYSGGNSDGYSYASGGNYTESDNHRFLAAASSSSSSYASATAETTDLPIALILAGHIGKFVHSAVTIRFCFPGGGKHKELIIPMNVDFCIHRNGEWCMLMLGESLLSLLIVDVSENDNYYATFFSALLTVILLQYLHFRSQPHHADAHAWRRNKDAGVGWTGMHQIYSAALVSLGAAFTLMVLEFTYQTESDDDNHRRFLAGGGASKYEPKDRRQRTALLFSISLATIWFCLDCMTIFHLGIKTSHHRCQCSKSKVLNVKGIILVMIRVGLILFMATLGLYETDPQNLAIIGLFGVVLQLILRKLGTKYLSANRVHALGEATEHKDANASCRAGDVDPEENKWPNVTHAVAQPAHQSGEMKA